MGYPFSGSFSYTNAFYDTFAPGNIGEMGLHHTILEEMARSAVIKNRNYKAILTASFFHPIMKNERYQPNEIF